jgi:hypothetical protein
MSQLYTNSGDSAQNSFKTDTPICRDFRITEQKYKKQIFPNALIKFEMRAVLNDINGPSTMDSKKLPAIAEDENKRSQCLRFINCLDECHSSGLLVHIIDHLFPHRDVKRPMTSGLTGSAGRVNGLQNTLRSVSKTTELSLSRFLVSTLKYLRSALKIGGSDL